MMALKALGQIVSTTGCVISPYLSHPELLDGLINIIQSPNTHNFELRCEATRAFGILGVADPAKLKKMRAKLMGNDGSKSFTRSNVEYEAVKLALQQEIEDQSDSTTLNFVEYMAHNKNKNNNNSTDTDGNTRSGSSGAIHNVSGRRYHRLSSLHGKNQINHHHSSNQHFNTHLQAYHQPGSVMAIPTTNYNNNNKAANQHASSIVSSQTPSQTNHLLSSPLTLAEYYPAVTINALVNILRDPMLGSHHIDSVHIASHVMECLPANSLPLLHELVD